MFTMTTTGGTLTFGAARFEDVEFLTYRDDLRGEITCGARTPPVVVLITYRPSDPPGKLAGTVVAVEFPPIGYVDKE
jgi:hypothetical protein